MTSRFRSENMAKGFQKPGKYSGASVHASFLSYNFSLKCSPTFVFSFVTVEEVKRLWRSLYDMRGEKERYMMLHGDSKENKKRDT